MNSGETNTGIANNEPEFDADNYGIADFGHGKRTLDEVKQHESY